MSLTGLGPQRHVYDDLGDAEKFHGVPLLVSGGAEGSAPLTKAQASLSDANFLKEADGNLST